MRRYNFLLFSIFFISMITPTYAFDWGSAVSSLTDAMTGDPVGATYNAILAVKDDFVNWLTGTDGAVGGEDKETTQEEFESNDDTAKKLANGVLFNSTAEANNDINSLREMMESNTVQYTVDESGATGTAEISVYGKDKIYGYSVFPVRTNVKTFDNPDRPDPTHITKVEVSVNGNLWKRVWEGDWKTEGGDFDYTTLLKTPDTYAGNVKAYLTNNVDEEIDDIIHSNVDDFEINVRVEGYKEIWVWHESDDGDSGKWVHERNADFTTSAVTTNMASAVADGFYNMGGYEGSFPASYTEYREKWTPVAVEAQGASSNVLLRVWSNPVHVLNSDVGIDGFLLGAPGYLDLYGNTDIVDDYRIVSVRVDGDGNYYVANSVSGKVSTFSNVQKIGTTIVYNGDEDTIGFRNYLIICGTITRDDGMQLPVWIVARMKTTVVSDYRSLVGDTINDVKDIVSDDEISTLERVELEKKLDTLYDSLDDKIESAETWASKAEVLHNDKAKDYAVRAKDCYEKAKEALADIDLNDADSVRTNMKKASELELAGDYYIEACKKEYAGLSDDAEVLSNSAKTLEDSNSGGLIVFGDDGVLGTIDEYVSMIPGGWTTAIIGGVVLLVFIGSGGTGVYKRRHKYN